MSISCRVEKEPTFFGVNNDNIKEEERSSSSATTRAQDAIALVGWFPKSYKRRPNGPNCEPNRYKIWGKKNIQHPNNMGENFL